MSRDDTPIEPIPAITAERDDIMRASPTSGAKKTTTKKAGAPAPRQSSGSWMLVALCLVGVVLMAGWSFMLQNKLSEANKQLVDASARLQVLEERLSVTDESMNQSGAALAVKLKEMDFEIRKLWDNVWKKSKQRLAGHDKELATLKRSLDEQKKIAGKLKDDINQTQLAANVMADQVDSASQAAEQVDVLQQKLAAQEQALARLNETLNAVSAANAALAKRVSASEEWDDSFNAFRTQTNRKLQSLQSTVNSLQGP